MVIYTDFIDTLADAKISNISAVRFKYAYTVDSYSPSSVQFYSLPFCEGTGKQKRHKQDLGETLSGSHKVTTPYELTFLDPVPWRSLCEEYLDAKDVRYKYRTTR